MVVFGVLLFLLCQLTPVVVPSSPYIDNRSPNAIYVIPIYQNQSAVVHCVSYFEKTVFQQQGTDKETPCQRCELKHVQNTCCRLITWDDVRDGPLSLVCTLENPKWGDDDPNIPRIPVSVVRRNSGPFKNREETTEDGKTIAYSSELYFCNHESNVSHLTAGSHIGLGWVSVSSIVQDEYSIAEPTTETSVTEDQFSDDLESVSDDARTKLAEFSKHYSNSDFQPLWVSEDEEIELLPHKSSFTCNETAYYLPKGSRCMTPSPRAYFIMTNCNLVEQIFIVIGVIVLLILLYIIFNVLVWLWDYMWNKSHKNDDDLVTLT